jgi:hypothetical protein
MGDDSDLSHLWLEGNLDDYPLGKEAERCAREAEEGLRFKPKGFVSCPYSWAREVRPLFHNSPSQFLVALAVYSLLKTGHAVPIRNSVLVDLGVNRRAKYSALTKLAKAGLITLNYAPGRATRAMLLWMPPVQSVAPLQGSINKKEK